MGKIEEFAVSIFSGFPYDIILEFTPIQSVYILGGIGIFHMWWAFFILWKVRDSWVDIAAFSLTWLLLGQHIVVWLITMFDMNNES